MRLERLQDPDIQPSTYTVRCQKLRFSRFKACFADCRDSTKRTNIEWGNVRSFHLSPLWGYQDLNKARFGDRSYKISNSKQRGVYILELYVGVHVSFPCPSLKRPPDSLCLQASAKVRKYLVPNNRDFTGEHRSQNPRLHHGEGNRRGCECQ